VGRFEGKIWSGKLLDVIHCLLLGKLMDVSKRFDQFVKVHSKRLSNFSSFVSI
jgi:hypothetical protein